MQATRNILCFGDSLTWGWIPVAEGAPTSRYPYHERWTGVMATQLGVGHCVIEEALSARTTTADDPLDPRLNGSLYLPSSIASHLPIDLVIILLGTNDTKVFFDRTPFDISIGMAKLVGQVLASAGGIGTVYPAPKCLVVAPPPIAPIPNAFFRGMWEGAAEKSKKLSAAYQAMAEYMQVDFLDAGDHVVTEGCDGIHLTVENNRDLGLAMARKAAEILRRL